MGLLGRGGLDETGSLELLACQGSQSVGAKDKDEMFWSIRTFHIDSTVCSVVFLRVESSVLMSDANSGVPSFPVCTNDHQL